VLTETTAELAAALTLAAARRVVEGDRFMRAGQYKGWLPNLFVGSLLQARALLRVGAWRGVVSQYVSSTGRRATQACRKARRQRRLFSTLAQRRGGPALPRPALGPQLTAGAPPGAQNKTVGIVGAGRIGAAYARMLAEGHKMDIVYFDPYPNKKLEEFIGEYGKLLESKGERAVTIEKLETVEDVLKRADVRGPHRFSLPASGRTVTAWLLSLTQP